MGYELELTGSPQGDHVTGFCTTSGYSRLCKWLESLPGEKYPALAAFAAADSYEGTDALVLQLDQALLDDPPDSDTVRDVANRLADLLGNGHEDEIASVIS